MVQVLAATFKDGVFKPDQQPALSDSARVRLVVETIDGDEDDEDDGAAVEYQPPTPSLPSPQSEQLQSPRVQESVHRLRRTRE